MKIKVDSNLITTIIVSLICAGLVTGFLGLCALISWGVVYVVIFSVMIPFMYTFVKQCISEGVIDMEDVMDVAADVFLESPEEESKTLESLEENYW